MPLDRVDKRTRKPRPRPQPQYSKQETSPQIDVAPFSFLEKVPANFHKQSAHGHRAAIGKSGTDFR